MDYAELRQGIRYCESKWAPDRSPGEYSYEKLRDRDVKRPGYWLHLESMDESELAEGVIEFLNQWKCRIPVRTFEHFAASVVHLRQAVDQLPAYYGSLTGSKIEDVDFECPVTVNGQKEATRNVIDSIYSVFLRIPTKFGPVPASKLMHMALPDLFVMWDDGIIDHHCIPIQSLPATRKKERSYLGFLILMQENICHAIDSYNRRPSLTREQVVQEIRSEHRGLSLPRLLDMANMAVRDCEQAICIPCMRKAKDRWSKMGL